ncbi:MAG: hypothetical protein JSU70_20095 [Phycisphaerales bacterium]|nr:MAG: hypothetical protein JSU70_20095 [Phycisphaerales bacterium]
MADRKVVDLKQIVLGTCWNVPIYALAYRDATLTKNGEKSDGKDIRFPSMRAKGNDWFGHHFICFSMRASSGRYVPSEFGCDQKTLAETRAASRFFHYLGSLSGSYG